MKAPFWLFIIAFFCSLHLSAQSFTENFDNVNTLSSRGWTIANKSDPLGVTSWFQGNSTVFAAYEGAGTSFAAANFNSTRTIGTISNWLIAPSRKFYNGETIRFYTRASSSSFAERLQVRLSTAGNSTNVGSSATDVGDFTVNLLDINPDLVKTGQGSYPVVWTQFTITLTGLPLNGAQGRFAFRYFVTDGGASGTNSDFIGIDNVVYQSNCPDPVAVTPSVATVCQGGAVSLSAGTGAGSYLWSTGETTASIVAEPSSTTAYSVTAISGVCVSEASASVTVNSLPALTVTASGSGLITCAEPGVTLTATATGSSAFTYTYSGSALSASPGSNLATVTQAGTFSVSAQSREGCVSSTTIAVSGSSTPVGSVTMATSGILDCRPGNVTLTAGAAGATSYTLLDQGAVSSSGQFEISAAGVYTIIAGNGIAGCNAVSSSLTIGRDNISPTVSVSSVGTTLTCTQPQLTLTATSSATALRWSTTETTTSITVSTTGVYSVTATGPNGCTAVSNSLTIGRDNNSPTVSVSSVGTTLTCTQPQLTLTATSSATALRWPTTETTTSITVSTTGVYSVTATGPNGCTAVSNSLTIGENFSLPPFTVTSATVCPGQTTSLSAIGCSGTVQWSNNTSGAVTILTAGSSTSLLTATCTVGICSTTASGQLTVGGIQPPPAQILSFTADESACPVRLTGRGVASSFTMTGAGGYVFSTVFREGGTREAIGLNVKQPGMYTLSATYTNSCGTSEPVMRSVSVSRSCP